MKIATRAVIVMGLAAVLAGCHNSSSTEGSIKWFPPVKDPLKGPVNCTELKRQQLYNMTNMNMETNTTTPAQRAALDDYIAKNCK